jgi:hypothetical protein
MEKRTSPILAVHFLWFELESLESDFSFHLGFIKADATAEYCKENEKDSCCSSGQKTGNAKDDKTSAGLTQTPSLTVIFVLLASALWLWCCQLVESGWGKSG